MNGNEMKMNEMVNGFLKLHLREIHLMSSL